MSNPTSQIINSSPGSLQAHIGILQQQLDDARDQAALNLLQLKQVQDELEFYVQAHQHQAQLLQGHHEQALRASALIKALLERIEKGC